MPKRDVAYMTGQRELIAKAALQCLLEKGVAETSIRDICAQAGVSIGAFYIHFSDKQQVIFAACEADIAATEDMAPAATWREYSDSILQARPEFAKTSMRKRLRLTYQFLAELAVYDSRLPGFKAAYDQYFVWMRDSLANIHAAGEIELSLGLEQTTMLHAKLYYGTVHVMTINHDADLEQLFAELITGLAVIAGLKSHAG